MEARILDNERSIHSDFCFRFQSIVFSTKMSVFLPYPSPPPRASVDYVELVADDVLMVCGWAKSQ